MVPGLSTAIYQGGANERWKQMVVMVHANSRIKDYALSVSLWLGYELPGDSEPLIPRGPYPTAGYPYSKNSR